MDLRAVDTGEVNVYLEPGRYLPVLCPVGRQVLSPEERRIAAYVDTHGAEAVKLLERTVNINSETLNPAFGQQPFDIAMAERKPGVQPDGVADDLCQEPMPMKVAWTVCHRGVLWMRTNSTMDP